MIRFDQVFKRYPNGREALSGVTFNIESGALTFLTGHSGAGKSSILKLIALIERPTRGQVIVNSQNTSGVKPRGIPHFRRQLGVVFQDHKLLHDRPVADNVALPLVIAGVPRREIDKRVRAALDQVGLLGREKSLPLELPPASSSAWASREPSSRNRPCSLPMNRPAIWIPTSRSRS